MNRTELPLPLHVYLPETSPGQGTGHIRRAIRYALEDKNCYIYISSIDLEACRQAFPELANLAHGDNFPDGIYLYDRPQSSSQEVQALAKRGMLIAIDGRGPVLDRAAFALDMLPREDAFIPNISDPAFLDMPKQRRSITSSDPASITSVLVSFGGEDYRQQAKTLHSLGLLEQWFPQAKITVVQASRMVGTAFPNWQVLDRPPVLKELLANYQVVITMLGLTAFEAQAAGCLTLLWNPSAYHETLAKKAGFASLGAAKKPKLKKPLRELLDIAFTRAEKSIAIPRSPVQLLRSIVPIKPWTCPACASSEMLAIERFEERTFGRCATCSMVSMLLLAEPKIEYSEAYFFDEYKAQYGKTYLEDFEHIQAMGQGRIAHIKALQPSGKRLLDLGAAYGPFLAAARDAGFEAEGIDISSAAVAHCQSLGFKARVVDLNLATSAELTEGQAFDVITLWYVIEHFSALEPLLALLSASLRPGGILALASPSFSGISRKRSQRYFLEHSPWDHYTIWDPSKIQQLMHRNDFTKYRVIGAGHHPERFPGIFGQQSFRAFSLAISKVFGLADTFELYAVKNKGESA